MGKRACVCGSDDRLEYSPAMDDWFCHACMHGAEPTPEEQEHEATVEVKHLAAESEMVFEHEHF